MHEIRFICGNPEEIAKKARVGFTMRAYDQACLRLRQGVIFDLSNDALSCLPVGGYIYRWYVTSGSQGKLSFSRFQIQTLSPELRQYPEMGSVLAGVLI